MKRNRQKIYPIGFQVYISEDMDANLRKVTELIGLDSMSSYVRQALARQIHVDLDQYQQAT